MQISLIKLNFLVFILTTFSSCSVENKSNVPRTDYLNSNTKLTHPNNLCHNEEAVLFDCKTDGDRISICGVTKKEEGKPLAIYREVSADNVRLQIPKKTKPSYKQMTLARRGYAGGGEIQFRFPHLNDEFVVFTKIIRVGFGTSGPHEREELAGVTRVIQEKPVSTRYCENPSEAIPKYSDPDSFFLIGNDISLFLEN